MPSHPADDVDKQEEIPLKFIDLPEQDELTQRPLSGKEDVIIEALGQKISHLQLVRLMQSAAYDESKDDRGRVYRMHITKVIDNDTYRYRLGLLDDGQSWGVMSKARIVPTLVVKLRGVWLIKAPAAVPTRLFSSPEGLSKIWTKLLMGPAGPCLTNGNEVKKDDEAGGSQATDGASVEGRHTHKRKLVLRNGTGSMQKSPRTARYPERNRGPVASYNEILPEADSLLDADSDSSDDVVLRKRPRHKP